jgi:predicted pyridoxine 5'-phosphate oxidase superfamily flavin-nucleotide-binding protein
MRARRARVGDVKLTGDMQRVVSEQRLGFVATVTPDGAPNLSPKGTTIVWDDEHLMFADIASPGTVANLASNPQVEVNVVDPIRRKGYRFKGRAATYSDGAMFDRGLELLHAIGSTLGPERARSIVVIEVTDAAPLISPAYDDGTSEATITDRWLRHYDELHGRID